MVIFENSNSFLKKWSNEIHEVEVKMNKIEIRKNLDMGI